MRLLLVQLPTSHLGAGERVYPLGLSRLSALVPRDTAKAALDLNLAADPWPELRNALQSFQPDVVGLSFRNLDPLAGHQASYLSALKTAAGLVRALMPQARIWAGGPAFSLFAERIMLEAPELDAGIIGEGETALPRLLSLHRSCDAIPGLVYRTEHGIVKQPGAFVSDLDTLPGLDVASFPPEAYLNGNAYVACMGIESKRGCDLRCAYCIYPCIGGGKHRFRSPKSVVDEMERLHKDHGVRLFHFTDPVLNRPPEHLASICRELLNRKLHVEWTGFFREDSLSESLARLASEAGLAAFYFSGDALTEQGLRTLNKRMTKEDLYQAARIAARSGVITVCHFLVNLPGESKALIEEARTTLDRILDIHARAGNLGAVVFNNVRLYPGAPLTRKLANDGSLDPATDLLYPTYFNPPTFAHVLHEMEAHCHLAGVFSRLGLTMETRTNPHEHPYTRASADSF